MKLDRKQDPNILYQVCIFRANPKNKMAALADSSKRLHIVLRCTICGPLGLLFCFYIVTASYESETMQVNPEQLDVITEEGDRGTK